MHDKFGRLRGANKVFHSYSNFAAGWFSASSYSNSAQLAVESKKLTGFFVLHQNDPCTSQQAQKCYLKNDICKHRTPEKWTIYLFITFTVWFHPPLWKPQGETKNQICTRQEHDSASFSGSTSAKWSCRHDPSAAEAMHRASQCWESQRLWHGVVPHMAFCTFSSLPMSTRLRKVASALCERGLCQLPNATIVSELDAIDKLDVQRFSADGTFKLRLFWPAKYQWGSMSKSSVQSWSWSTRPAGAIAKIRDMRWASCCVVFGRMRQISYTAAGKFNLQPDLFIHRCLPLSIFLGLPSWRSFVEQMQCPAQQNLHDFSTTWYLDLEHIDAQVVLSCSYDKANARWEQHWFHSLVSFPSTKKSWQHSPN